MKDKNLNKKRAMILGELVFALFVCGILLLIAINMFRSNDVTKTPKIYSVLKNLPEVNQIIMEDCYDEGTCTVANTLPESVTEYCTRLGDLLVTAGEIDCSTSNGETATNMKLTNGTTIIGFGGNNWDDDTIDGRQFLDLFIDVKGNEYSEDNAGSTLFPIRVFENGDVIPGANYAGDDEFFAYRIILDRAANKDTQTARIRTVLNANDGNNNDDTYLEKVSFEDAICLSNPDLISTYYKDVNCDGISRLDACENKPAFSDETTDNSAFCTVEPVKPRGSGIFKIFGI